VALVIILHSGWWSCHWLIIVTTVMTGVDFVEVPHSKHFLKHVLGVSILLCLLATGCLFALKCQLISHDDDSFEKNVLFFKFSLIITRSDRNTRIRTYYDLYYDKNNIQALYVAYTCEWFLEHIRGFCDGDQTMNTNCS
jgi:hypothetical protein